MTGKGTSMQVCTTMMIYPIDDVGTCTIRSGPAWKKVFKNSAYYLFGSRGNVENHDEKE